MKNPAVDAYIAKSADFAQPILRHVRKLMHKGCPRIEETIKWGVPAFEREGIVAMMAAFKKHVASGSGASAHPREARRRRRACVPEGREARHGRAPVPSRAELPADAIILRAVKFAVALNEAGERPTRALKRKPPPKAPPYLAAALKKNAKARATFGKLTPGKQREYVDWLVEAKQEATRERRLAQAIELLAAGKQRYWKYQDC